jgi:ribosomal protein S12 methylthiotransferase
MRVHVVSLGCAKNRVDTEKTVALLLRRGCRITDSPDDAECLLVNSCGFIEDARRETIETVLELAEHKRKNPSLKLAVMGCMVELFKKEMGDELPEIDYLFGLSETSIDAVYSPDNIERALQPGAVSAYLKIAEGCGNSCSFCSIPIIRGPLKSRPPADIASEAALLVRKGVKELCLVAQDTTRYGADLGLKNGLLSLLGKVVNEASPEWLRILYVYPTLLNGETIDYIASEPTVCPYIDIPFQHIDTGVLKRMGRQETETDILRLLEKIRKAMPDGAVRSAFIVGFPGESEEEFNRLARFLVSAELDHVGVFTYSPEEGTKAALLKDDVPPALKRERRDRLMEIQRGISRRKNRRRIGSVMRAMVESFDEAESLLLGRLAIQAPEVDGELILDNCTAVPGEFLNVKITDAMDYDLIGEPV